MEATMATTTTKQTCNNPLFKPAQPLCLAYQSQENVRTQFIIRASIDPRYTVLFPLGGPQ